MKINHKKAIVTVTIGPPAAKIAQITHPIMEAYARKVGAEFAVISTPKVNLDHPEFEKLQIYDLLEEYDRLIYFDTDIIVMPGCPNMFEIVAEERFGAFFDSEVVGNDADIPEWRDEEIEYFQSKYGDIKWKKTYFNTGVMVISRGQREIMDYRKPTHCGKRFIEQTQLNYSLQKSGLPHFDLGPKFNHLVALSRSKRQFDERFGSHVMHYAGFNLFYGEASLYDRIKRDAASVFGGTRPGRTSRSRTAQAIRPEKALLPKR